MKRRKRLGIREDVNRCHRPDEGRRIRKNQKGREEREWVIWFIQFFEGYKEKKKNPEWRFFVWNCNWFEMPSFPLADLHHFSLLSHFSFYFLSIIILTYGIKNDLIPLSPSPSFHSDSSFSFGLHIHPPIPNERTQHTHTFTTSIILHWIINSCMWIVTQVEQKFDSVSNCFFSPFSDPDQVFFFLSLLYSFYWE